MTTGLNNMITELESKLCELVLLSYSDDDIPQYKLRQIRKLKTIISNLKRQQQKQDEQKSDY